MFEQSLYAALIALGVAQFHPVQIETSNGPARQIAEVPSPRANEVPAQQAAAVPVLQSERAGSVTPAFLTSIAAWLSENFELPSMQDLPRVEFAPPTKLAAMRHRMVAEQRSEDGICDHATTHQREVVAFYNDATRTIFLPDTWSGKKPADVSVLVHETVHHLQNLAGLKYECPAAREKLAYQAQSEWLKRSGQDLESAFGIDMLTLRVSTACMN